MNVPDDSLFIPIEVKESRADQWLFFSLAERTLYITAVTDLLQWMAEEKPPLWPATSRSPQPNRSN
jgi:hypothetical protein